MAAFPLTSAISSEDPLTPDDLAAMQKCYLEHGFCYVRGAVDTACVDDLVEDLWKQAVVKTSSNWNGLKAGQPRTYPTHWPLLSISLFPDPQPLWRPLVDSAKLGQALDGLLGGATWEIPQEKYNVYFPIKLPEPHEKGRRPETCDSLGRPNKGWHVDLGKNFSDRGLGTSRTIAAGEHHAAVVLFVLSDTEYGEGGTTFLRGSPRLVADTLKREKDMSHQELLNFCNAHVTSKLKSEEFAMPLDEAANQDPTQPLHAYTGKKGDAIIFHPWAMHAPSRNYSERGEVRFMGNAVVAYKQGAFKPWFTEETKHDLNVRAASASPTPSPSPASPALPASCAPLQAVAGDSGVGT